MWRIATETRQRDKFGPGKDGFTRGNIATGLSLTQLEPDWFDNVQEEVSNVIEIELGPLDSFDRAQLWKAIDAQIDRKVAGIPAQPAFVLRAGDTMTGVLTITAGLAPPIAGVSTGTRLVLFPGGGSTADIALGIMAGGLWSSVRTSADYFAWYAGPTEIAHLNSAGFAVTPAPTNRAHLANKGYVDDLFATFGGYLPLTGGTITGALNVNGLLSAVTNLAVGEGLTVHGAGIVYSRYSANWIGFGWDGGGVNSYVDGQHQGRIVIANPSAVIGGNLDVAGNGHFGALAVNTELSGQNITGHNQVVTNYFRCTTADLSGNTVIGGQLDISGGGFIYAIDRCYRGYEINLEPGGIFSAAHGASYQGGPWNTALVLHTRAEAIEPYEHGLAVLRQLQPMIYSERRLIGIALEDCRGPMPEMIVPIEVEDDGIAAALRTEPPKTVEGFNAGALTYALVNAVKELADRLELVERALS